MLPQIIGIQETAKWGWGRENLMVCNKATDYSSAQRGVKAKDRKVVREKGKWGWGTGERKGLNT